MSLPAITVRHVELTAVQRRTREGLIGLGKGPDVAPDLAVELRARLEERVDPGEVAKAGWSLARPLWVGKGLMNDRDRCDGLLDARIRHEGPPFEHSPTSGAGVLFHRAIELDVASERGVDIRSLCERAARGKADFDKGFGSFWNGLDELDRAELLAEAGRLVSLFRDSFPPLPRSWQPQTELPLRVRLAEGRIVLSGTPDLVLGRSRRLVVDLKSGGAWPEHPEDVRFYALLMLLRTGLAPYRVATFFLQSGEWQSEDVTRDTVEHAADRVVESVTAAVRLAGGAQPELKPGPHCSWCPRSSGCPAAARSISVDGVDARSPPFATAR
jgi:hypothetical protein